MKTRNMLAACLPLISLFCIVLLTACKEEKITPPQPQQVLRIEFPSIVKSLDPYSEATLISGSIYNKIYDSLVYHSHELQLRPSLATQWSNPDEKTWIFELRKDVKFHDGTPLTAEDVKFSFETLKKTASATQATALTVLDKVEILDPYTVRMTTHAPASNFVRRIYSVAIVSKQSYKTHTSGIPVGTGPYRVKSWDSGRSVYLESTGKYWGGAPPIREIRYAANSDTEANMAKLLNGEVDVIPMLEPDSIDRFGLKNRKDIVVRNYPGLLVVYLGFDTMHDTLPGSSTSGNPFRDLRVRKAFYQAINTDAIIQEIQKGYAEQATQLVAPMVYGFNPSIKRLPYDPEASRSLLAQAGYPKGFSVRLDIPNDRYRADVKVGDAVVKDLAAIGIRAELNAQKKDEWMRIRLANQTPFFLAGWVVTSGDAAGALDYLIHTPETTFGYGRTNSGGYSNAAIDAVIEKAARTTDAKERLDLLEQAMDMAMQDCVAVPLYVEQNLAAHRAGIEWTPRADGIIDPSSFRFLETPGSSGR